MSDNKQHAAIVGHRLTKVWQRHRGHKTTLLHQQALHIPYGATVALWGPSGAGKSSLLHLCAGLDERYDGELWLLGQNLRALSDANKALMRRRDIGFASQHGGLIRTLSVMHNITLPLWMRGDHAPSARALHLLEELDMAHLVHCDPKDLSGGEVARATLARALVHQPKLLLADEPTHALDGERRRRVTHVLLQAAQAGTTVVVATHDEALAQAMGRTLRIGDGMLVDGGPR